MTYQELIAHIRDLGFSDDDEVTEFGELVFNAINRSISEIETTMSVETPNMGVYEFTLTNLDTGTIYIDMSDDIPGETEGETVPTYFVDFADTPMMYKWRQFDSDGNPYDPDVGAQFFSKFTDYEIMNHNTIILNASDYSGDFKVMYKKAHTKFTGAEEELPLDLPIPLKAHHLVPLLASYYVWLEDEPTKAAQYYNLYEQRMTELQQKNEIPKMRVLSGGM